MTISYHFSAVDTWTVDDLEDLPTELRYEIHNGNLLIKSPAKLWHQRVAMRICRYLERRGLFASIDFGLRRTASDARVPDVAALRGDVDAAAIANDAWHDPTLFSLVVEVWSPSSDKKDHEATQWYADRGIPEYWLAKPVVGDVWGATVTRYRLGPPDDKGVRRYVEVDVVSLEELEQE